MTTLPSDGPAAPLPVSGRTLSSAPGLADAVGGLNSTYRMDYFDDHAVRRMLDEHRAAYRRTTQGAPIRLVSIAGTVGLAWLLWTALSRPERMAEAMALPASLLAVSVLAFALVYRQGKRRLRHPHLEGYRHVLAAARAHGVAVTHVPDWLTGRGGGGVEAAPLPPYAPPLGAADSADADQPPQAADQLPRADQPSQAADQPQHAGQSSHAAVPPPPAKPAGVAEYERVADRGGWHDEVGWLCVIAAGVGVTLAAVRDQPEAYAALLFAPLAAAVWITGYREGRRKRALEAEARAYVNELSAAQPTGAALPELSPQLRRLFDDN
ncbi:hypothetical protein ACH429_05160 [Streptomyces pathocidini]|uniref:Uncharacterized protein n=1 Tax=Streptomyces pathocidini TaxID=1650571 RepID=A0ABW7ULH3_9ACTN|nr:hypothetical protein [Streptomyces pathocidini]